MNKHLVMLVAILAVVVGCEEETPKVSEQAAQEISVVDESGGGGFTGTVAETIKVELPDDFQTAEFMVEHGFVDMIVTRSEMRREIARIIDYCKK